MLHCVSVQNRNVDSFQSHSIHAPFVRGVREKEFAIRGVMNTELNYDLMPDQWETLKALRTPASMPRKSSRHVLESLVALELVETYGDFPVITAKGRKVLIRGSSRLLDVAA